MVVSVPSGQHLLLCRVRLAGLLRLSQVLPQKQIGIPLRTLEIHHVHMVRAHEGLGLQDQDVPSLGTRVPRYSYPSV